MKSAQTYVVAAVAVVMSSAVCAAPPVSAFTNFSQIETLEISPNGKYLALTKHSEQTELLTVLNYPDVTVAASSDFGNDIDIDELEWANDTRLLIQPARRFIGT